MRWNERLEKKYTSAIFVQLLRESLWVELEWASNIRALSCTRCRAWAYFGYLFELSGLGSLKLSFELCTGLTLSLSEKAFCWAFQALEKQELFKNSGFGRSGYMSYLLWALTWTRVFEPGPKPVPALVMSPRKNLLSAFIAGAITQLTSVVITQPQMVF